MRYKVQGSFSQHNGEIVQHSVAIEAETADDAAQKALAETAEKAGVRITGITDENGINYYEVERVPAAVANAIALDYGHRGRWEGCVTRHWEPELQKRK